MIETSNAMIEVAETDPAAVRHEAKVQTELNAQHEELRRQAQGIFDAIKGRRGAITEAYWEAAFVKAHRDYDSGKFLIARLGGRPAARFASGGHPDPATTRTSRRY